MSIDTIYATGLHIDFLETRDLEEDRDVDSEQSLHILARNAWRILMMGWTDHWHRVSSWRSLKAVFYHPDPTIIQVFGFEFQNGLNHVFKQLSENPVQSEQQRNQAQLYISNCLTYIPFIEPTNSHILNVPQWIKGQWRMVEFSIDNIELTDPAVKEGFVFMKRDRVFAHGLKPTTDSDAEGILVLPGTTYPMGQGFLSHIVTDFKAFQSTGESIYYSGRPRIKQWLDSLEKKPKVCGVSLGGSLSLLLAIDIGNHVSRVDAFNPAGLYTPLFSKRNDNWDRLTEAEKPEVVVQKQADDVVSLFGDWKHDFTILQSHPDERYKGSNGFSNHPINLAGFAETRYIAIDPAEDNSNRKLRNLLFYSILRAFFYYCAIVPLRYVLVPSLRIATFALSVTLGFLALAVWALIEIAVTAMNLITQTVAFIFSAIFKAAVMLVTVMLKGFEKGFERFTGSLTPAAETYSHPVNRFFKGTDLNGKDPDPEDQERDIEQGLFTQKRNL